MRAYLLEYIKELEANINKKFTSKELENIRIKITFFQHERLIHLLVTLFYAIFTLTFLCLSLLSCIFLIPFFISIIFLLFYVRHYFFLEQNIQYLYKLYDKACKNA